MRTCKVFLRERCDCPGTQTHRRPFLLGVTAMGGLGNARLARAVRLAAVCGLLVALKTSPAGAQQIWYEATLGDAPALIPGQYPTGSGTVLDEIHGDIGVTPGGETADMLADLYCIKIPNLNQFTATVTTLSSGFDSISLFLFDNFSLPTPGLGITMHAGPHQNQIPPFGGYMPFISGAFLPPGSGEYWLGVAHGRVYPSSLVPAPSPNSIGPFSCNPFTIPPATYLNSGLIWDPCNPGPMFQSIPPNSPPPNGPGGPAPLTGWPTVGFGAPGTYEITLTGAGFCNQCLPPPSDMYAWWALDELAGPTAVDIAGPTNNLATVGDVGTYMGLPAEGPGEVADALFFNGSTDFVQVPSSVDINLGTGDFTIDAWVRRAGASPNSPPSVIIDKRDSGINCPGGSGICGYHLAVSFGNLIFQMNGNNYNTTTVPVPPDDNWHFVAVTVNRATNGGTFYIDGNPLNTFTPLIGVPGDLDNPSSLRIGAGFLGGNQPWLGGIDEVEIFKRALLPQEIADIFNVGKDGKCKGSPIVCPDPPDPCDDGLACNGCETSDPVTGECQTGAPPCGPGLVCNEAEDTCVAPIPTLSEWGLVVLTLLLLIGGKIYFGRRQTATAL